MLRDGTRIVVRPLAPTDRDQLRDRYVELSPRSRRLRFVSAPVRLSERLLDHLLDVDFEARYAVVAELADEPVPSGVGIARWARRRDDPSTAEAAVTVLDGYQGRGIGTILLTDLVGSALAAGITTFVADVMWENSELLASLRAVGANVIPGEPGIAAVRVDLPATVEALRASPIYEVMRTVVTA